jgi:hypothetical protein
MYSEVDVRMTASLLILSFLILSSLSSTTLVQSQETLSHIHSLREL